MGIPVKAILEAFQRMEREHWPYVWGDAKEGSVDCSGAFVWAYRQHGKGIYHGSNRIARTEVLALLPVSQAQPGMMAFKAREPTESGYALPDKYKPGGAWHNGDLRDYHHIGLVDEDPRYVLNAKSTKAGFVRSKITESWDFVAYATQIDYGGTVNIVTKATVKAPSGGTVNMRRSAGERADLVCRVPVGDSVTIIQAGDAWSMVGWGNFTGYMMSKFLTVNDGQAPVKANGLLSELKALVAKYEKEEG